MKVVINTCFGGFSLSKAGMRAYFGRKCKQVYTAGTSLFAPYSDEPVPPEFALESGQYFVPVDHPEYNRYSKWYSAHYLSDRNIERDDPDLIAVVEELGRVASGQCADLVVVVIPDDVAWEIVKYYGNEHVAEKHRTWS